MPRARSNGIEIEYESFGDASAEPVVLINGLGSQMTRWPAPFCEKLAARGYRAIRFDNRDVGLSTWPEAAYRLEDMAADVVGLLDHLQVRKAHVAGVSMGGMIAQLLAADHGERVLSLTSIMSTPQDPMLAQPGEAPSPAAAAAQAPDPKADFEGFVAFGMALARQIGSPGFPFEEAYLRQRVIDEYRRAYNPAGVQRQTAAIRASGDRTEKARRIQVPTVVLHGDRDPLIPPAGGEATARAIPGAELRIIEGMGHDVPPLLFDTIIDAIVAAAERARAAA